MQIPFSALDADNSGNQHFCNGMLITPDQVPLFLKRGLKVTVHCQPLVSRILFDKDLHEAALWLGTSICNINLTRLLVATAIDLIKDSALALREIVCIGLPKFERILELSDSVSFKDRFAAVRLRSPR